MHFFKKLPRKLLIGLGIVSLVIGIAVVYFFTQYNKPKINLGVPTPPPVPKTITSLLKEVGEKTILPQEETPTVATVSDLSKLDQAFFLKAEKGDKVLMFIDAKQAYLYRPSTDQIINKGTLEIITDEDGASESAELTASPSAQKTDPSILRVKF